MTDPVKEMEDTEISEKPGDKTEQIDDGGIKADGIEEKDISKLISRLSTNSMSANPKKMEKDEVADFIKSLI